MQMEENQSIDKEYMFQRRNRLEKLAYEMLPRGARAGAFATMTRNTILIEITCQHLQQGEILIDTYGTFVKIFLDYRKRTKGAKIIEHNIVIEDVIGENDDCELLSFNDKIDIMLNTEQELADLFQGILNELAKDLDIESEE